MQHDIYSLGVILLEIGLWTSFLSYDSDAVPSSPASTHSIQPAIPNSTYKMLTPADDQNASRRALANKRMLEGLAERELRVRMGSRYADIVLLCLRCLDTGGESDGKGEGLKLGGGEGDEEGDGEGKEQWTDVDGVVIGVRFIENVLEKIQGISI